MHRRNHTLGLAVAATCGMSGGAQATTYTATLQSQVSYSPNGSSLANLSSSTATWQYDDATGVLTQTGGTFNTRFVTSPTNTLFRHVITGLVVGGGAAAEATSYDCREGNFGGGVGASICGNYNFRFNAINDSTSTWGPGTSFSRTLGGDDMALGPQQNLAAYDGITEQSFVGSTVVLSNATCVNVPFQDCSADPDFRNTGFDLTLTVSGAGPDAASTRLNTPTAPIDILGNDPGLTGSVTLSITSPPSAGGTVAITSAGAPCADPCLANPADLRVILTPSAPLGTPTYTETFTYQTDDGVNPAATADVTVTVDNVLPAANDGAISIDLEGVAQGSARGDLVVVGALGNLPGDPPGPTVTASDPARGSVAIIGGTTLRYSPDVDFTGGTDAFTYTLTDGDGESASATVSVTVTPASSTGQREGTGGSSIDLAMLALCFGCALIRRRPP